MTEQARKKGRWPIWYLVGWMLFVIGFLIFIAGILNLFIDLPATSVVIETRPNIWWGGFIAFVGGFYIWKYTGKRVE